MKMKKSPTHKAKGWWSLCGLQHPRNLTQDNEKVTCPVCRDRLDLPPLTKSPWGRLKYTEEELASLRKEVATLKKAMREIMHICLETLHQPNKK